MLIIPISQINGKNFEFVTKTHNIYINKFASIFFQLKFSCIFTV